MSAELSRSLLDRTRVLTNEALLELNDVFGVVDGPRILDDVDAAVEAQVGNSGRFNSAQYRIDAWPDACLHLATHIADIRDHQTERLWQQLKAAGYDPGSPLTDELVEELRGTDTKVAARAHSVGRSVIEIVINHAPRKSATQGENGSIFYAGLTASNLIFYAQKHYLLDLLRDGRIIELHRVKNQDNHGLWPDGHQFRSAEVANTRSIPASRELVTNLKVPEQDAPVEIVWIDKFGNSLLRVRDPEAYSEFVIAGQKIVLVVDGRSQVIKVGSDMDSSPTNKPRIFKNPKTKHPRYLELVIKSDNCLSGRGHALQFLRGVAGRTVALRDLRKLALDLEPA